MSAQHTPGPWKHSVRYREVDGAHVVCGAYIGMWPLPMAEIYDSNGLGGSNGGDAVEQISNARLIAAAPDLLAALESAELAVEQLCQGQDPANQCWFVLTEIRAAIAKAKGGAV